MLHVVGKRFYTRAIPKGTSGERLTKQEMRKNSIIRVFKEHVRT
jgi:hypothetical protein